jgi:outer membrane protein assembly factor BamB
VVWSRPLGSGFSGISIAGDCLVTCFGDAESSFLVRLDPATGEELWRLRQGPAFEETNGDGPRSTPTIDGDGVFAMSSRAQLFAVGAADGKQRWSVDLGALLNVEKLEFRGYASSPLIEGDRLVILVGPTAGKTLAALDKHTGEIVWTALSGRAAFSSPIAATIHGRRQIVAAIASGLAAVDAASGEELWEFPWEVRYDVSAATPVFLEPDRVFHSVGYDKGALMLTIGLEGDHWSARPAWTKRVFRNHFSSSVHHAGYLYGFDEAMLKCIDAGDGEELWRKRGLGKGTLIYADGVLIALGGDGLLALIEATPEEYRELGSMQVFETTSWTAPTLAGGRLYLRDRERIVCLDLRSGGESAAPEPQR